MHAISDGLRLTKIIHSRLLNIQIMTDFATKVATNKLSSFETGTLKISYTNFYLNDVKMSNK